MGVSVRTPTTATPHMPHSHRKHVPSFARRILLCLVLGVAAVCASPVPAAIEAQSTARAGNILSKEFEIENGEGACPYAVSGSSAAYQLLLGKTVNLTLYTQTTLTTLDMYIQSPSLSSQNSSGTTRVKINNAELPYLANGTTFSWTVSPLPSFLDGGAPYVFAAVGTVSNGSHPTFISESFQLSNATSCDVFLTQNATQGIIVGVVVGVAVLLGGLALLVLWLRLRKIRYREEKGKFVFDPEADDPDLTDSPPTADGSIIDKLTVLIFGKILEDSRRKRLKEEEQKRYREQKAAADAAVALLMGQTARENTSDESSHDDETLTELEEEVEHAAAAGDETSPANDTNADGLKPESAMKIKPKSIAKPRPRRQLDENGEPKANGHAPSAETSNYFLENDEELSNVKTETVVNRWGHSTTYIVNGVTKIRVISAPPPRGVGGPSNWEPPILKGRRYKAVLPYTPGDPDELPLERHDIVMIEETFEDNWAICRKEGNLYHAITTQGAYVSAEAYEKMGVPTDSNNTGRAIGRMFWGLKEDPEAQRAIEEVKRAAALPPPVPAFLADDNAVQPKSVRKGLVPLQYLTPARDDEISVGALPKRAIERQLMMAEMRHF